jgi:hypothetical protein
MTATNPTDDPRYDMPRISPEMHDREIASRLAAAVDDRLDWQEDEDTGASGDWFPADREDHEVRCDVSDWWVDSGYGPPARLEELVTIDHNGVEVECRVIVCLVDIITSESRSHITATATYTVRVQHVND